MSATQTVSALSVGARVRQKIGRHGQIVVAVGQTQGFEAPSLPLRQAQLTHQTANARAPATVSSFAQPAHDARAAVLTAAFGVRALDQRQQLRIGLRAGAGRPIPPGVIAAARNVKRFAQFADGVIAPSWLLCT